MVKRLLVVDGNQAFFRLISRAAGSLGFLTEQCHNSQQARDAFLNFKPEVVMIGLCMPDKEAFDLAKELLLTGIPVGVIFVLGYGAEYLRRTDGLVEYRAHPNVSVLGIPFRRAELNYALAKVMTAAASRAEVPWTVPTEATKAYAAARAARHAKPWAKKSGT